MPNTAPTKNPAKIDIINARLTAEALTATAIDLLKHNEPKKAVPLFDSAAKIYRTIGDTSAEFIAKTNSELASLVTGDFSKVQDTNGGQVSYDAAQIKYIRDLARLAAKQSRKATIAFIKEGAKFLNISQKKFRGILIMGEKSALYKEYMEKLGLRPNFHAEPYAKINRDFRRRISESVRRTYLNGERETFKTEEQKRGKRGPRDIRGK